MGVTRAVGRKPDFMVTMAGQPARMTDGQYARKLRNRKANKVARRSRRVNRLRVRGNGL